MTSVRQAVLAVALAVAVTGFGTAMASDDGSQPGSLVWTRLGRVFGGGTVVDLVTLPDGGVLAGGAHSYPSARIWLSADGVVWEAILLPGRDHSLVNSVDATDGAFLAVGVRSKPDGSPGVGVVWTSRDGLDWSEPSEFGGERPVDAIATSDGYAVVTAGYPQDGPQPITVWHSADGMDWQASRVSDDRFESAVVVAQRSATGAWVLAAAEFDQPVRLWRSDDGRTWEPTAEVVAAGWHVGRLLAVPTGFLFVDPTSDDRGFRGSTIWHSVDGREWTEVTTTERSIMAMAAGPSGVVALTTPLDRSAYKGDFPVSMLMSEDGLSWSSFELPDLEGKLFHRLAVLPGDQVLALRRLHEITWLGRPSDAPPLVLPEATPDARAELLDFKALVKSRDHPEGEFDEVGDDIIDYFETEGHDLDPLHLASPPIDVLVRDCERIMRGRNGRLECVPVFLRLYEAHGLSRDRRPYELADRWLGVTMAGAASDLYRQHLLERMKWSRNAVPDWFDL